MYLNIGGDFSVRAESVIGVFDLDNTVAPYEHLQPDKATQDYFAALAEAGVQTALVSNNRRERIELFNERLGVFIVADAQKPSPRGVHRCIEAFGLPPEQVLFVGDQIFTDVFGGNRAGALTCYVETLDRRFFWINVRYQLERGFIARGRRRMEARAHHG